MRAIIVARLRQDEQLTIRTLTTGGTDLTHFIQDIYGNIIAGLLGHATAHQTDTASFTVAVAAVADAPTVGVPAAGIAAGSGLEDAAFTVSGLSAVITDPVDRADHSEVLSVKISCVPDGTVLSEGSNNGDGSWTIPASALDANGNITGLTITPPTHFAGDLVLMLTSYTLEPINGSTASTSKDFTVHVDAVAEGVQTVTSDGTVEIGSDMPFITNTRLDGERQVLAINGSTTGLSLATVEIAQEQVELTLTGLPAGMSLVAHPGNGGTVTQLANGTWTFLGTKAKANTRSIATSATTLAGTYLINVETTTTIGSSTLATPVADQFRLTVGAAVTAAGATASADVINGTSGHDTIVDATAGNDVINRAPCRSDSRQDECCRA